MAADMAEQRLQQEELAQRMRLEAEKDQIFAKEKEEKALSSPKVKSSV